MVRFSCGHIELSLQMKFYLNVMDDVLAGVREAFLDEGVDEQVLQELRQMWETKVQASKAIDPPEIVEPQPPPLQITQPPLNDIKPVIQTKQSKTSEYCCETRWFLFGFLSLYFSN